MTKILRIRDMAEARYQRRHVTMCNSTYASSRGRVLMLANQAWALLVRIDRMINEFAY
jgi:hypothetical protein